MQAGRLARLTGLAGALSMVIGCSQTSPTSPTAVPGAAVVGAVSQETPAVPAAIVPVPPNALGAARFLSFGDSITEGVESGFDGTFLFDVPAAAYPLNLQGMLNRDNWPGPFTVTNRGIGGERASTGVGRLPGVLQGIQPRPQVLLLLEGINDMNGGVSAQRAAASVVEMVQIGRLFNCTVLVGNMFQTYTATFPDDVIRDNSADKVRPFNDELTRLTAGLQNVHIVDVFRAFRDNGGRSLIGNDGLHPNSAGYARLAQTFHAAIVNVFPVRGGVQ